jgi:hypothetical protein
VHAYIDPATGERYDGAAGGLVNIARKRLGREPSAQEIEAVVRRDQERRMSVLTQVLGTQGYTSPPRPRGETRGGQKAR